MRSTSPIWDDDSDFGGNDDGARGTDRTVVNTPATEAVATAVMTGQVPQSATLSSEPVAVPERERSGQLMLRQYLLDLIEANTQNVTLLYGDIQIIIPSGALKRLLGDAPSIRLDASCPAGDRFLLRLWVDEAELFYVDEGVTATFLFAGEDEGDYFLVQNEKNISARYQSGTLTATIQNLGEYSVLFEEAVAPVAATIAPEPSAVPEQRQSEAGTSAKANVVGVVAAAVAAIALYAATTVGLQLIRKRKAL